MTVLASGGLGAGLTGFFVVIALVVAAVFLFRSMLRHLRKVPPTFEPPQDQQPPVPPTVPRPSSNGEPRPPEQR